MAPTVPKNLLKLAKAWDDLIKSTYGREGNLVTSLYELSHQQPGGILTNLDGLLQKLPAAEEEAAQIAHAHLEFVLASKAWRKANPALQKTGKSSGGGPLVSRKL